MEVNYNKFLEASVFANKNINKVVDNLYQIIGNFFDENFKNNFIIVGSVAKNLQDIESSIVKDLDIQVTDKKLFDFCKKLGKLTEFEVNYNSFLKRIFIKTPFILIELWYNTEEVNIIEYQGIKIKKYG